MKSIETLKDLKDVLLTIPDKDLDMLGIGTNDEGDGEITVITTEPDFIDLFEKYEQTALISDYIRRILDAHKSTIENEEYSSTGFI
ncbi:hypothetical protein LCGC14_0534850 [marine sediment metagenome]|uniref:Uncharacterized protein n=1 Tax=marine sediment metagenome TaxID=412755 RepID=A0A0F9RZ99_9ZZZZ